MTELVPTNPNKLPDRTPAKKSFLRIQERQEEQLNELMRAVAQKLLTDMTRGRVSFFHDKKTGELLTEVYSVHLRSAKLPKLMVDVWKNFVPGKGFADPPIRLLMGIYDFQMDDPKSKIPPSSLEQTMSLAQRWGAAKDDFELSFTNYGKPLSHRDKINFLQDILTTEVDEEEIASHFGRPYHKGDSVTYADNGWRTYIHDGKEIPAFPDILESVGRRDIKSEDYPEFTEYWVRDLWSGRSLLESGPLPEPKALSSTENNETLEKI